MEKILRSSIAEDPNVGLYGFATDKYCLIGSMYQKNEDMIRKVLHVKLIKTSLFETSLAGIFSAGNSSGIAVTRLVEDHERRKLENEIENVCMIDDRNTAIGNLIVMNDNGIILSPLLKKHKQLVERQFGLESITMEIAKSKIVGNTLLATNKGCIVHPRTKPADMERIGKILGVPVDIGTVNFGSPLVKSGIIANSFGFITSEITSGPELGRITEALGFL